MSTNSAITHILRHTQIYTVILPSSIKSLLEKSTNRKNQTWGIRETTSTWGQSTNIYITTCTQPMPSFFSHYIFPTYSPNEVYSWSMIHINNLEQSLTVYRSKIKTEWQYDTVRDVATGQEGDWRTGWVTGIIDWRPPSRQPQIQQRAQKPIKYKQWADEKTTRAVV